MTNKKKGALLISAFALIALLVVGGTLAYFTSQDTAENVFTLGKVSGELTETTTGGTDPDTGHPIKPGTETDTGITYDKVMPGDWLSKEPVVAIASDSEDAYARVRLEVVNADGKLTDEQKAVIISATSLDFGADWVVAADGNIYYQKVLTNKTAGLNATEPVFTVVKVPGDGWGNAQAQAEFSIKVTADLIQADNFTPIMTGTQITGWGGVAIEPEVTPEP